MNAFAKVTADRIMYNLIHLRQLVFEVTDACNLCCKYCGYSELYEGYDKRENLKFPFHRAKLIIDYLFGLWSKSIFKGTSYPVTVSFYGGEPTLNMKIIQQIIDYIESLPSIGRTYNYAMTTNAMLLDKYMDFFIQKKIQLLISLDGDRLGQSYRVDGQGRESFDQVIENIKLLKKTAPDYFETNVSFNSVIHDRNSVESTYMFIKNYFSKETRCVPLSTVGVRRDKKQDFDKMYNGIVESIKNSDNGLSLEKELFVSNPQTYWVLEYIRMHSGNVYDNYSQLLINKKNNIYFPTGTCIPFSKKMFVTVRGRILQCEKIDHKYSLGVVNDEKVIMDLEYIARQYNKNVFMHVRLCER